MTTTFFYIDDSRELHGLVNAAVVDLGKRLGRPVEFRFLGLDTARATSEDDALFVDEDGSLIAQDRRDEDGPSTQKVEPGAILARKPVELAASQLNSYFLVDIRFGRGVYLSTYGLKVARFLHRVCDVPSERIVLFTSFPDDAASADAIAWCDYHPKNDFVGPHGARYLTDRLCGTVLTAEHAAQRMSIEQRSPDQYLKEVADLRQLRRFSGVYWRSYSMTETARAALHAANAWCSTVVLIGEAGVGKAMIARAIHGVDDGFLLELAKADFDEESPLEAIAKMVSNRTGLPLHYLKDMERIIDALGCRTTVFFRRVDDFHSKEQGFVSDFLERHEQMRATNPFTIPRVIVSVGSQSSIQGTSASVNSRLRPRLSSCAFRLRFDPLRSRLEDIEPLVHGFLSSAVAGQRRTVKVETEAITVLRANPWSGNVRELEAVIASVTARAHEAGILRMAMLPAEFKVTKMIVAPSTAGFNALFSDAIEASLGKNVRNRVTGLRNMVERADEGNAGAIGGIRRSLVAIRGILDETTPSRELKAFVALIGSKDRLQQLVDLSDVPDHVWEGLRSEGEKIIKTWRNPDSGGRLAKKKSLVSEMFDRVITKIMEATT